LDLEPIPFTNSLIDQSLNSGIMEGFSPEHIGTKAVSKLNNHKPFDHREAYNHSISCKFCSFYPNLFIDVDYHEDSRDYLKMVALPSNFNEVQSKGDLEIKKEGDMHTPIDSHHDHEL